MRFRQLPDVVEVDVQRSGEPHSGDYDEKMDDLEQEVLDPLKAAQRAGKKLPTFPARWALEDPRGRSYFLFCRSVIVNS